MTAIAHNVDITDEQESGLCVCVCVYVYSIYYSLEKGLKYVYTYI